MDLVADRLRRGALAGAGAAVVWAAAEPPLRRALGTPYSDVRLLGRLVTRTRLWPLAGLTVHALNGAAFGAAFAALGGRGVARGLVAAQIENAAAWPLMLVLDRAHPDRRSGAWPPLATDARIWLQETLAHALFGAVLGAALRD
jgi:hypothetical protein